MNNYIILGDSIVYGMGDYETCGWATLLKKYIMCNEDPNIYRNLVHVVGFPGATSRDVLSNLESILDSFDVDFMNNAVILSIGVNDAKYFNGDFEKSKIDFKNNIHNIIDLIKKRNFDLIIVGLTRIVMDESGSEDWYYTNDNIEEYNIDFKIISDNDEILKNLCADNNIKYIQMCNTLSDDDYADGLHPNTNGHKKIYEVVKDNLK